MGKIELGGPMKKNMYLKDVIVSLIQSVDLVNYLLKDHHRRVSVIAHAIGIEMRLNHQQMLKLILAASLHDVGALYVSERDELIDIDTNNPIEHAVRGSFLLKQFDYFEDISTIVLHHHRHWGHGAGNMFDDEEVAIECFVLHLADRIEILLNKDEHYAYQVKHICTEIINRRGEIFHPECVEAFLSISKRESFWLNINEMSLDYLLNDVLGTSENLPVTFKALESLGQTFSNIVDYRSHFTASHSKAVAMVAYALGKINGFSDETSKKLRIAGYLHDIGKIGVPTELIDKASNLTVVEKDIMKSHAYYTYIILNNIIGLEDICKWASMHHEKRDGSGYPFHVKSSDVELEIEVLAISDILTALSENRPYRQGLYDHDIKKILLTEYKDFFSYEVFNSVIDNVDILTNIIRKSKKASLTSYKTTMTLIKQATENKAMIV